MIKYTLIYGLLTFAIGCVAQKSGDEKIVKTAILEFAKAADAQDVKKLESLLDRNFRIVMNQLFGSTEISLVDRAFYLSKIESKEWGGDNRKVTIESLTIVGNNASAKVTLAGEKSTIISLLQLVKDADGNWKVINDVPALG